MEFKEEMHLALANIQSKLDQNKELDESETYILLLSSLIEEEA